MCLLCDGFFSFAVVRQMHLDYNDFRLFLYSTIFDLSA